MAIQRKCMECGETMMMRDAVEDSEPGVYEETFECPRGHKATFRYTPTHDKKFRMEETEDSDEETSWPSSED